MPAPVMQDSRDRSRRRNWLFRVAAMAIPFLLFAGFEGVCHVAGWGAPQLADDPFVGFTAVHPLFEHRPLERRWRIAPARRPFFADDSFADPKPADGFRIFCLGGSTVQGRPWSVPTAFTTWLRLALQQAEPTRQWEVVNCGGVSYASYRLVPILTEVLRHQPDLIILCTGHNEFLEDRTYAHIKEPHRLLTEGYDFAREWRSYQLVRRLMNGPANGAIDLEQRPILSIETDPILDYHDSLAAYHWDDGWQAGVEAHFEFNVARMVELANDAEVPLVLMRPCSNLADCPPFKSEHPEPLTAEQLARWESARSAALAAVSTDLTETLRQLTIAAAFDPYYAGVLYDIGKCEQALGRPAEARRWLVRARDCDVCPLRMTSSLEAALDRVAERTGTPVIDLQSLLEAPTPERLLGAAQLVDHIHPTFEGHQAVSKAVLRAMEQAGLVTPTDGWETRTEEVWRNHLASLDIHYFARGRRQLDSLRGWAAGRADGPPAAERFPWRVFPAPTESAEP
ncbi:MAG: SGNH/GDSL hydrolase family protein [Planctomycetaceae bacterium]